MNLLSAATRHVPKAACLAAALAFAVVLALTALPGEAGAKPGGSSGSRGGSSYSRPSGGSGYSRPGGGSSYSRPSSPGGSKTYVSPFGSKPYPSNTRSQSAGDEAQSRSASGKALKDYRSEKEYDRQFTRPATAQPSKGDWSGVPRENYDAWNSRRATYYGGNGWSSPGYAYNSRPSFGMWDAMWMWFLLDNLTRPGHASFFHNHASDPGYQEWRREADRLAKDNPELKAKLDALDADMKARQGQPRDPNYMPPGADRQIAMASANVVKPHSSFPWGFIIAASLLVGAGWAAYMYSTQMRERPAGMFKTYVRNKVSGGDGGGDRPRLFRVGMVVTVDEAPFILAGDKLSVEKPGDASEGRTSAEAIGFMGEGSTALNRIYISGGGFFQIHLDRAGQPDECRWFSRFDEFTPTGRGGPDNGDSWAFWLDDEQGQVGWPLFQTPDGAQYERVWAPGEGRTSPLSFSEELTDAHGTRRIKHEMMLYQRPTGLDAPAPEAEYALLDVVEDGKDAWISIYMGVDVNPASLSLA